MCSLDVSSLFTNVPVDETIEIIVRQAYNNHVLAPPKISAQDLRQLLKICTQETPFSHKNKDYIQIDGVSMGSPLGPTFADFYMSYLENKLLLQTDKASNPVHYFRYVDDIFVIFRNKSHIHHFIRRLESNSQLKFTHEAMQGTKFNFLDLALKVESNGRITTSIYIKSTDKGVYANFQSHVPLRYKKAVINSLVNRAIKFSSTWIACSSELDRIKQVLVNNDYPQKMVDEIINRKLSANDSNDSDAYIKFYFCLQNLSRFSEGTKQLKSIIQTHVKSSLTDKEVRVITYFRPKKLSSKFTTRSVVPDSDKCSVVYQFDCPVPTCNVSYIGHTTQTLRKRAYQHRRTDSSIFKHYWNEHHELDLPLFDEFLSAFSIVYSSNTAIKIKIAEAILIKSERPYINVKYDVLYDMLKLF